VRVQFGTVKYHAAFPQRLFMEGSMNKKMLLRIVGMGMIMFGVFATSWFGQLDWNSVPFHFRLGVGASQFCFLFAGIILGVSAHRS
jgi:hypothetical protein